MNPDDDPVAVAFRRQREARAEITELLGPRMSSESVLSMLDEYGPNRTTQQLKDAPEKLQCYSVSIQSEEQRQRVEAAMLKYAECTDELDRAVAAREAAKAPQNPDERTIAFHGELALVNTKAGTMVYLSRPHEQQPLNFRPHDAPFMGSSPQRRRSRGRSR